jgi:hypothetical protein
MAADDNEADWKVLRQLRPVALERLCARILGEISLVCADATRSHHQRYLDAYDLIRRRDKDVGMAFADMRRSRTVERVMWIKSLGLLTDDEFGRFSAEMRLFISDQIAHRALS